MRQLRIITITIQNRQQHRIDLQISRQQVSIRPIIITHILHIRMHSHMQIHIICIHIIYIRIQINWHHLNHQQHQIHHQVHHLLPSILIHHHKLPLHRCSLLATIIIIYYIIRNIQMIGIIQQHQQHMRL